jgi:hypothetical protein
MDNSARKKTLSLDFDGVIHSYKSGWQGADRIPDDPVPNGLLAIRRFLPVFDVVIFSARNSQPVGIEAMQNWLGKHGLTPEEIAQIGFPVHKPAAHVHIDDRALCFNGEWRGYSPTVIQEFKTWQGK